MPGTSSRTRRWSLALAAGLAAGVLAWTINESRLNRGPERARDHRLNNELRASEVALLDARFSFGTLGALMGLGLGVTGGMTGRSVLRAGLAGAAGLVLGGLAGGGTASWLVPIYYDNLNANDLTYSLEVNGGIWGAVGAAAGLAFGIGRGGSGQMFRLAIAGLAASFIAMALFVFAGSLIAPHAMVERPLALTPGSRLAAQLLLALSAAASVLMTEGPIVKQPAGPDSGP